MTPIELGKKLIEAREKATQGKWSLGNFEAPVGIESSIDTMDWVVCPDDEYNKPTRQDADFIALAANHITEVCERLIKVEKMLEKCKEQRNGWTKKYWWDQKMSADSIEDSIKKVMSNFDAELEKVGEK